MGVKSKINGWSLPIQLEKSAKEPCSKCGDTEYYSSKTIDDVLICRECCNRKICTTPQRGEILGKKDHHKRSLELANTKSDKRGDLTNHSK